MTIDISNETFFSIVKALTFAKRKTEYNLKKEHYTDNEIANNSEVKTYQKAIEEMKKNIKTA